MVSESLCVQLYAVSTMLCSCSIGLNLAPAEPLGQELVAMIVSAAAAASFVKVVECFCLRFTKAV